MILLVYCHPFCPCHIMLFCEHNMSLLRVSRLGLQKTWILLVNYLEIFIGIRCVYEYMTMGHPVYPFDEVMSLKIDIHYQNVSAAFSHGFYSLWYGFPTYIPFVESNNSFYCVREAIYIVSRSRKTVPLLSIQNICFAMNICPYIFKHGCVFKIKFMQIMCFRYITKQGIQAIHTLYIYVYVYRSKYHYDFPRSKWYL